MNHLLATQFDLWILGLKETPDDAERRALERAFFVGAGVAVNLIAANISEEQLFERMKSLVAELRTRFRTKTTN